MKNAKHHFSILRPCSGSTTVQASGAIWLLSAMTVFGLAILLFAGANLYYHAQLLSIAQEGAEYGLNQAYLFGLRRQADLAIVEANTQAHLQPLFAAIGASGAQVKFTSKVANGYPYGTATILLPAPKMAGGALSIFGAFLPKQMDIVETATVVETDSIPPYISCFAITRGGPWQGGYLQVPTISGGPFNGTTISYYNGSIAPPPAGTIGSGASYLDASFPCTLLEAPHRSGFDTTGGWEY